MDNDDTTKVTEKTKQFVQWYKNLSADSKEIAASLMIANLDDACLLRIKTLTTQCSSSILAAIGRAQ